MRICSRIIIALAALSAAASAGGDAWRLEKERDGIQVGTRAVEGWSIREIRATARIPARLSAVVAVLCDIDATAELNDLVSEARIVQRDSETRYRIYSAMKMPWPVSDRDIVNQRQITQDPDNLAVTIEDLAVGDAIPPRKGYLRLEKSRQVWTLVPAGAEVVVEMHALADSGGPIPAVIVNAIAVDGPLKTLTMLKRLAQSPRYADARLSYVREPTAG